MPYHQLAYMTDAMNILVAEEQLRKMDASIFPKMTKENQKSTYKKWTKQASSDLSARVVKNEDLILSV